MSIDKREANGLKVAVSGSFHRHMEAINVAVQDLVSRSVRVLSPADPRVVAQQGEFLFVASDRVRSIRLVQDRHLECIRAADFLWLVCPDGYVGQSASMELGFAVAVGVPIFAAHAPADLTLRQYITAITTPAAALRAVVAHRRSRRKQGILIDPHSSVEEAHDILTRVDAALSSSETANDRGREILREMSRLRTTLTIPTCTQ